MSWSIYTLSHPATGEVRYVGFTSKPDPSARLNQHRARANRGDGQHVYTWWRKCLREHGEPVLSVIDSGSGDPGEGLVIERCWIAMFRLSGSRLTNATDGGEGVSGHRHTPESKAKIGAAIRGRKQSDEWVKKRTSANIGRVVPDEQKARMSATIAKRGSWGPPRRITDQEIADIRASVTGRKGERAAIVRATPWSITTINRALDESLWSIPDGIVGIPIALDIDERAA